MQQNSLPLANTRVPPVVNVKLHRQATFTPRWYIFYNKCNFVKYISTAKNEALNKMSIEQNA